MGRERRERLGEEPGLLADGGSTLAAFRWRARSRRVATGLAGLAVRVVCPLVAEELLDEDILKFVDLFWRCTWYKGLGY